MGSRQEAGFDSRVILTRTVRPPKTWHPPDTHYNTADTPSSTNCQHARLARGIGHGGVGAVPYPHTPPLIGHRPPRDFIFFGASATECARRPTGTLTMRAPRVRNCQHARLARGIGHGGVGAVPHPRTPPFIGHRPPRDLINFLRGLGYGVCAASHRHTHDAHTPRVRRHSLTRPG